VRYVSWLGGVLHGDFGRSYVPPEQSVGSAIASRLPVTIELALAALLIALVVSVPLGMITAQRQGTRTDSVSTMALFTLVSIPGFLLGLFLVFLFVLHRSGTAMAVGLLGVLAALWTLVRTPWVVRGAHPDHRRRVIVRRVTGSLAGAGVALLAWRFWPNLPRQGFSRLTSDAGIGANLRSVVLPAVTLSLVEIPVLTAVLRSDTINTLQQDFILFARAKGVPDRRIMVRHALRPSLFSFLALAGVTCGRLLGGAVIVETIFSLPGMGSLIVNAVANKDFQMVQGSVLVVAVFYVLINAVVDVASTYIDPRVRRAHR
jgi:peptide/nickel transport system permease protein